MTLMVGNSDLLTGSSEDRLATQFQELESPQGELHLRFYVAADQQLALPATGIREIISAPLDRITPIPNTSPMLLGTLNLRGRVIWVADLGQFLGKPDALNTERSEIPVIAVEEQDMIVGLAVNQIIDMEWLDVEALQMLTNVPEKIAPYLRGEWFLNTHTRESLQLLDQKAILRSALWSA